MQGNGRPKRCFWRVNVLLCPLKVALEHLKTLELMENILLSICAPQKGRNARATVFSTKNPSQNVGSNDALGSVDPRCLKDYGSKSSVIREDVSHFRKSA